MEFLPLVRPEGVVNPYEYIAYGRSYCFFLLFGPYSLFSSYMDICQSVGGDLPAAIGKSERALKCLLAPTLSLITACKSFWLCSKACFVLKFYVGETNLCIFSTVDLLLPFYGLISDNTV